MWRQMEMTSQLSGLHFLLMCGSGRELTSKVAQQLLVLLGGGGGGSRRRSKVAN